MVTLTLVSLLRNFNPMKRILRFLFLIPVVLNITAFPQDQEKTKILYSGDHWEFNKNIYEFGPRILGNVVMNHDSAFLYCDSAYVNEAENKVIAYGLSLIHI